MNYSIRANFVNISFIALIFIAPVGYCLYDTTIPLEIGRTVIVLSFLLAGFVIADWYHMYSSNSFRGAFSAIAFGAGIATVSLLIAVVITGSSIVELAMFERVEAWENGGWFLRAYIAGIGLSAASIVGVARLLVITGLGESDLPTEKHVGTQLD